MPPGRPSACGAHVASISLSPVIHPHRSTPLVFSRRHVCCPAMGKDSSTDGEQDLSRLEIEVPRDQRPVNELRQLKDSVLYSWATLDVSEYVQRLGILWGGVFVLLGLPISLQSFDMATQPLQIVLSASMGSLTVVAAASLRIYLGWKYVGDRLMTAILEYEETGWYDGQYFVKPPEILTRDRLVGMYEVRPVIARLKTTLQGTAALLVGTALALVLLGKVSNEAEARTRFMSAPTQITPDGMIFSPKVSSLSDLKADDEAAEAEAEAQGGVPGYCRDRYFSAFAGGERVCDKFSR